MFKELIERVGSFEGDVFRNIPHIVITEDLLDDLSGDNYERAFGETIVGALKESDDTLSTIITRPFTYGVAIEEGAAKGVTTRFSDGTRFGVWYGSLTLLTTVYETIYHWKQLLHDIGGTLKGEIISERRIFLVRAAGLLVDLRGKYLKFPQLLDPKNYSFAHRVGAYLYDQDQAGLIVESARHRKGINVAVFKPRILSNVRHNCYLTYKWVSGEATAKVQKVAGKTWKVLPWG